jgi:hypothetical protein
MKGGRSGRSSSGLILSSEARGSHGRMAKIFPMERRSQGVVSAEEA